jgi:hypothetical protein
MPRYLWRKSQRFLRALVVVLVSVCGGLAVYAQSDAAPGAAPKFSVVSVKPGDPGVLQGSLEYRPEAGKFSSNAATLDQLIGFAYDVRPHQIVGGPKWRDSSTFAIEALAESSTPIPAGPAGTQMFRTMLQGLLAERFQLIARQAAFAPNGGKLSVSDS